MKTTTYKKRWITVAFGALTAFVALLYTGCNGTATTNIIAGPGQAAEIASSVLGGLVSLADSNVTIAMVPPPPKEIDGWRRSLPQYLLKALHPLESVELAHAAYTIHCAAPTFGACTNGAISYTPGSCTISFSNGPGNVAWTGGSFTLTGSCGCGSSGTDYLSQPQNCTLTMTTPSTGMTRTLTGGSNTYSVTVNTTNPTGWNATIPTNNLGIQTTCTGTSGCGGASGGRTINIGGMQVNALADGNTYWFHTVTSPVPFTVTGVGPSRTITAGTLELQNDPGQYLALTVITSPLTYTSGCCFPTGGTATTTFSGGPFDQQVEPMTFGPNCGDMSVTPPNQLPIIYSLTHCI